MTVFTDISCPYCQQLHQDIPQLNAAGITVHYLPYPRQGLSSAVAQRMASIWCSKYPRHAMDKAWVMKPKCVGHDWRKAFHWPGNLALGERRPRYSPTASSERGIGQ
ncbi:thioredoxin fold domain-containing protein [Halomonas elongata]|uniref:thioredoxin fold domain-containing protein n=1 Tax=Halomonas elongata TaxID=2746 RepID=UPI0039C8EB08